MKIFDVVNNLNDSGEYILGSQETGSHACYLIYGVVKPGEKGRELQPGHGHEEIILVLTGDLTLSGLFTGTLRQGQALHLQGDEVLLAENTGAKPVVYIVSGGHAEHGHH